MDIHIEGPETFKYNVPQRSQAFLKANASNSTFLDSLLTRKLIYQFHRIFCETQEISSEHGEILPLELTVELSARYRDSIRDVVARLKAKSDLPFEEKRLRMELESADVLWSLVEFVYFRPKDSLIVKDLMEWASYLMGESAKSRVSEVLESVERPDLHPSYVNALFYSVFQADFTTAQTLLRNNSRYSTDLKLQQMTYFMEAFSLVFENPDFSPEEFVEAQRKVREAVRANSFADSDLFQTISGVLLGKAESYVQVTQHCFDSWYELLPAYVLFSTPACDLDNVANVAKTIYEALSNPSLSQVEQLSTPLDKLIFSVLSKRCQEMLLEICRSSGFWWFPVHLCDIFQKHDPYTMNALAELVDPLCNQFDENGQRQQTELSVRSKLLIDYGDSLLYSDYWNLAPDYLFYCGTEFPKDFLDDKVEKLTFTSFKKADWFWNLALRLDLPKTKVSISREMIQTYSSKKSFNEALCWALKSQQNELIEEVSNLLLENVTADSVTNLRIFDAPPDAFYQYPTLMLLQRFYQFRRCLLDGQAKEAATRLYELVRFGTAPIHFQLILFDQMSKLLDPAANEFLDLPQLNQESIMDLMRAVNIFLVQNDIINPKKNADNDFDQAELVTKVGQLRHSLCNALSMKLH
ncbi:unnamed protein product [Bursaphelenchus xylophilus]|uniref:Nuclear pore complex protein Nup85 n=1 Tax=Bursaphelenchus xylophilus TaxID=6326 RepID=A0A1I7SW52_BURXY|nr:unnamed protein product [Bursaphelenchus xylophilus]CAG9098829.1 unnamed protein product [Bursaphelenchus xylophilus]